MRRLGLAIALALGASAAHADEGMWLPSQLPSIAKELKAAGFRGDAKQLSDLTRAPMNAMVKVGGASGAFVSPEGLVLTNHHVAFSVIQYNTRPDRDLIHDGFVAANRASELPASPDYRVLVTTGFDRITDRILADARGKQGRAYYDAVDRATKAVIAECEREPGYRCSVADMYYGTEFYLVRQLELRDVRLVYAPPASIGNYGDEVDNFVWPRHSGDFTVLRAYVGRDGKPADYSPDNVPYAPPAHLQVSKGALKDGDFAMLAGYPGITYRHRSAAEFASQIDWQLPSRVELYGALIDTIEKSATAEASRMAYASQVASLKNGLKRAQGELDGLRRSDAARARASDEQAMLQWLDRQPGADAAKADITAVQQELEQARATRERDQLIATLRTQTQLFRAALTLQRWSLEQAKPDAERETGYQQRDEIPVSGQLKQAQRRYAPEVERALVTELARRYVALPAAQHLPEFDAVFGTDADAVTKRVDALYAGTRLADEAQRLALLKMDSKTLNADRDPLLHAAATLMQALLRIEDEGKAREGELLRLRPAYMRALVDYRRSRAARSIRTPIPRCA